MKFSFLKFLAVLIALGVMLALPKAAEAHTISGAQQVSYQSHDASLLPTVSSSDSHVIARGSSDQDDGCKTGCCTMTAACCSPAALAQNAFVFNYAPPAFGFIAVSPVLPQGPPYTLLRPPKTSA